MYADGHVHLRDFREKEKETVKHGLEVARDSGVVFVGDMPNTDPPIISLSSVTKRLKLAKEANVPEVFYGVYMGMTSDPEQIKYAIGVYRSNPQVIGFKLYAGKSVGDLAVINPDHQRIVYQTLASEGYDGVLAVHSEKEEYMKRDIWNPLAPVTHCLARPEKAEIESVKDQIEYSLMTGFKGKLHIAHISSPRAVNLVNIAKSENLDISCGVCPHHLMYDWNQMHKKLGIRMKMNPPLRPPGAQEKLLKDLRRGKINWIETDHAPHSLDEKDKHPYMSGIPCLPWWNLIEEFLRHNNFPDKRIREVTHDAVIERFNITPPSGKRKIIDRRADYPFNPFTSIEEKLGMQ